MLKVHNVVSLFCPQTVFEKVKSGSSNLDVSSRMSHLMDPGSKRILFHFVQMRASWVVYISEADKPLKVLDLHVAHPANRLTSAPEPSCLIGDDAGLGSSLAGQLAMVLGKPLHLSCNVVSDDERSRDLLQIFLCSEVKRLIARFETENCEDKDSLHDLSKVSERGAPPHRVLA